VARGAFRTTVDGNGEQLERKPEPLARLQSNIGDRYVLVAADRAHDEVALVTVVSVTPDDRPIVRVECGEMPRCSMAIMPAGRAPA